MSCFTWNTALYTPKHVIWLFVLFITFILLLFIPDGVGLDVVLGIHFCFHRTVVIHEYCLKEKGVWILALLCSTQLRSVDDSTTQPSACIHHLGIPPWKQNPTSTLLRVWGEILALKTSPANIYYLPETSVSAHILNWSTSTCSPATGTYLSYI